MTISGSAFTECCWVTAQVSQRAAPREASRSQKVLELSLPGLGMPAQTVATASLGQPEFVQTKALQTKLAAAGQPEEFGESCCQRRSAFVKRGWYHARSFQEHVFEFLNRAEVWSFSDVLASCRQTWASFSWVWFPQTLPSLRFRSVSRLEPMSGARQKADNQADNQPDAVQTAACPANRAESGLR